MKSIGILGISVHDHDAEALARTTLPRAERPARLRELATALAADELIYLATCNRVELLYRGAATPPPEELRRRLARIFPESDTAAFRHFAGDEAVRHLFEVASGLDSAVLGERDVQGQLRDALAAAREAGVCGPQLAQLVEEALRAARQVHLRTQLGAGRVSVAEIACEQILERVRRTAPAGTVNANEASVALIGVSPMTRRAGEILARERVPFLVVNRTLSHAEELVAALGAGRALALDEFRLRPPGVEAVLTATSADGAVLDRAALERLAAQSPSQEPPLVVDLAIPPDVDPDAARAAQVPRLGIDEIRGAALGHRLSREAEADAARQVVAEAVAGMKRRLAERTLAPVIARINRRFRDTALEGVERLLAGHGMALEGAPRDELERWAETLARRFAHLPTRGLRGLAATHGLDAVKSFLATCDGTPFAELADQLEELDDRDPSSLAFDAGDGAEPAG